MITSIQKLNRFLLSQSFYPIVLSSLLAAVIYIGRWVYVRHAYDSNLPFNLFLAWIPYLFSMFNLGLFYILPRQPWLLIIPGMLWLLFFPNAPYIITDFLHLENHPPVPMWYDTVMLASFAWSGFFLAIASLRSMHFLVKYYLGRIVGWIFALTVLALGGLGIYLGRFPRWNSWDIFIHPKQILKEVLFQVSNGFSLLRFLGFTVMFTLFLIVSYLMFVSISKFEEPKKRQSSNSEPAATNRL